MNGIEDRFRDAAETDMPPSRLSADAVYTAAWNRRRRRIQVWTAAAMATGLLAAVVGIDVRSSGDVADGPKPEPTPTGDWVGTRDGAVRSVAATDADHLFAVITRCEGHDCSPQLVGSDDAGATWTFRHDFGDSWDVEITAPAAGVLRRMVSSVNDDYDGSPEKGPKMFRQLKVSTDGRTWRDVQYSATPVERVPDGGWIECRYEENDDPCPTLLVVDPATARSAPLKNRPGIRIVSVARLPSSAGLWVVGWDEAARSTTVAISADGGRTWTTKAFGGSPTVSSVDGVTAYVIASTSREVAPTGPNPTVSPVESANQVYRTTDRGKTWEPVDPDRTLPAGAERVEQAYVGRDGAHVVLTRTETSRTWYTSRDNGNTYRAGGLSGLGDGLSQDVSTEDLVEVQGAGNYLAHDEEAVYHSTDGLTWTRAPVNPPR